MRLIDADALMKAMYHRAFETDDDTMWQSGCWVRYRAIEQVVKDQPIVRCKDCKHLGEDSCCYVLENGMEKEAFCSYGERKEDKL